tara:strand:- start:460 stop:678 length:219 start_codon:yes stop_codon:yes gene_type:complete
VKKKRRVIERGSKEDLAIQKQEEEAYQEFLSYPPETQARAYEYAIGMLTREWKEKNNEDAFHLVSAIKKMLP